MQLARNLDRFKKVFSELERLDVSQFRFLNLDDLATRYGARWPEVKDRIFETCECFISKRIGSNDLMFRAANGFVVLPGPDNESSETAEAMTRRIELELKEFFLGSDYLEHLALQAETESVAVAELFNALGSDALDDAAEAYRRGSDGAVEQTRAWRYSIRFAPVWCTTSYHIALRFAVPFSVEPGEPERTGRRILGGDERPGELLEFDIDVLRRIARMIHKAQAQGGAPLTAAPVHFETLANPRLRTAYAAKLACLPEDVASRLALHLVEAPVDAPAFRYAEATRLARRFCRRVFMDLEVDGFRPDRLDDARIDAIMTRAAPSPAAFRSRWNEFIRFRDGVRRLDFAIGLTDCADPDVLLMGMLEHGVLFAAGPLMPEPTAALAAPEPFNPFAPN